MRLLGRRRGATATAYPSPYAATAPSRAAAAPPPPPPPSPPAEETQATAAGPRRLTPFGFWLSAVLVSLVVAVVGAGIAVVIVRTEPVRYQSTVTLSIDQPLVLAQSTDPGEFAKLAALRYKYADYTSTIAFADFATKGTNIPVGAFHAGITASIPLNALLFQVIGQGSSPQLAQTIAGNGASALVRYVSNEMDSLGIKQDQRVQLTVVSPAQPGVKVSPSSNRELGAGGFVGGLLFVLALSLQALRRRFS